jgi:hypothetical protein
MMEFKFTSRKEELEKAGIIGREFSFISQKGNVVKGEIARIVSVMLGGQIKFSTNKGVEYLLSQIQEPIELVSLIKEANERIDEILVLERIEYNKVLETQEKKPFELGKDERNKLDSLIKALQNGTINDKTKDLLRYIVFSGDEENGIYIFEELIELGLLNFYIVPIDFHAEGVYLLDNDNKAKSLIDHKENEDWDWILSYNTVECFFTLDEAMQRYNKN